MLRVLAKDWRDIHLGEHFTLGECVVSASHPELAAKITPTIEQANNLFWLVHFCAQPARYKHGRLKVTSGLVSEELNNARVLNYGTEPTKDTQHLKGEALDLKPLDETPLKVFLWMRDVLKWKGELLYYEKRGHLHVALPSLFVHPDIKIITE